MADISDVDNSTIKDLYERLESLSCMKHLAFITFPFDLFADVPSSHYDSDLVLKLHSLCQNRGRKRKKKEKKINK